MSDPDTLDAAKPRRPLSGQLWTMRWNGIGARIPVAVLPYEGDYIRCRVMDGPHRGAVLIVREAADCDMRPTALAD